MLRTIFYLSFIFLASCIYDVDHIYVLDTAHGVCSKHAVTNKKTLSSRWVEDLPLDAGDGNISVTAEDFVRLTRRK